MVARIVVFAVALSTIGMVGVTAPGALVGGEDVEASLVEDASAGHECRPGWPSPLHELCEWHPGDPLPIP